MIDTRVGPLSMSSLFETSLQIQHIERHIADDMLKCIFLKGNFHSNLNDICKGGIGKKIVIGLGNRLAQGNILLEC